jgi:hypothetical protein
MKSLMYLSTSIFLLSITLGAAILTYDVHQMLNHVAGDIDVTTSKINAAVTDLDRVSPASAASSPAQPAARCVG